MATKATLHNFFLMSFTVSSGLPTYQKDSSTQMPEIRLQNLLLLLKHFKQSPAEVPPKEVLIYEMRTR